MAENFHFEVIKESDRRYFDCISYTIRIGEHRFAEEMTCWSCAFEEISKSLEMYLDNGVTELLLDDDSDDNIVRLTRLDNHVKVDVEPCYNRYPSFSGLCDEADVLRKLYFGLLFSMLASSDDKSTDVSWETCKMANYNKMKSRKIEEYFRSGNIVEYEKFIVRHILIFDGESLTHICDCSSGYHPKMDDEIIVYDKELHQIACVEKSMLLEGRYQEVADKLPDNIDFWVVPNDKKYEIEPTLVLRSYKHEGGDVFDCKDPEEDSEGNYINEYGFLSKSINDAMADLDLDMIRKLTILGADVCTAFEYNFIPYDDPPTPDDDDKAAEVIRFMLENTDYKLRRDHFVDCLYLKLYKTLKTMMEYCVKPDGTPDCSHNTLHSNLLNAIVQYQHSEDWRTEPIDKFKHDMNMIINHTRCK